MKHQKYLRGFAKITLILSIIVFLMIGRHANYPGDLGYAFACGFIGVPCFVLMIWLAIHIAIEIFKSIAKDFKDTENLREDERS